MISYFKLIEEKKKQLSKLKIRRIYVSFFIFINVSNWYKIWVIFNLESWKVSFYDFRFSITKSRNSPRIEYIFFENLYLF